MSFGKKLHIIRKQANLTQIEMGERLSIDQSTYSRYESEKTGPTIEIVKRVSDIFCVNINWLLETGNIHDEKELNKKSLKNNDLDNEVIVFMIQQQKMLTDLLNKLRAG